MSMMIIHDDFIGGLGGHNMTFATSPSESQKQTGSSG